MKKNKYLCPTWKRIIYKICGIIVILLLSLSYFFIPKFWENKEHIISVILYSATWMITRAGIKKVGVDDEKN